ncbi:hypothetical protein BvCms16BK_03957 [Escherichia coli]|nr:hypothetical protein BvCms16BK_03957 [Escherichia coli]
MMSLWDALRMNMMISYQELVRTFPNIALPQRIFFSFNFILKVKSRQFILCGLNTTAQNDKFNAKKTGQLPGAGRDLVIRGNKVDVDSPASASNSERQPDFGNVQSPVNAGAPRAVAASHCP